MEPELKAVINDLINKFIELLDIGSMAGEVAEQTRFHYDKGLSKAELDLNMNFGRINERLEFLTKYTFENIKGMNEEIRDRLRKELQQAFMNQESIERIKERVMDTMDVMETRARMIARTEMNRAENVGHLDGARQSGLKLVKVWDAHLDSRTSVACRHLNNQRKPIDGKFVYRGEEFDGPPQHVNCRCTLRFEQV